MSAASYVDPIAGAKIGRTDMGVDASMTPGAPIRAMGDATIVGVLRNWYRGQPLLWYRLESGPAKGRYVYVAEQITDLARPGQKVRAGDTIARYAQSGTGLEIGWATATGQTAAQATTGYTEGQQTAAGKNFAQVLGALSGSGGSTVGGIARNVLQAVPFAGDVQAGVAAATSGPAHAVEGAAADVAKAAVGDVFSGYWDYAKQHATGAALKGTFYVAGAAIAAYGLASMFGQQQALARIPRAVPIPVPV